MPGAAARENLRGLRDGYYMQDSSYVRGKRESSSARMPFEQKVMFSFFQNGCVGGQVLPMNCCIFCPLGRGGS